MLTCEGFFMLDNILMIQFLHDLEFLVDVLLHKRLLLEVGFADHLDCRLDRCVSLGS